MYQGYKQFADGLSKTKYSMYAILLAMWCMFFLTVRIDLWNLDFLRNLGAALGTVLSNHDGGFMHY
jgi:MATE family multidrug resistance protein